MTMLFEAAVSLIVLGVLSYVVRDWWIERRFWRELAQRNRENLRRPR